MKNILEKYIFQYPQLSLPIKQGMSQSQIYHKIIHRGIFPSKLENPFLCSPHDRIVDINTPLGIIPVLQIYHRADFIRFVQVISHHCEPISVPDSMGAVTYFNLINWRKIRSHQISYMTSGHTDWSEEFKRFTSTPSNYKDTLIVISHGPYSALPAEKANMTEKRWLETSLLIRTYHELTHLLCHHLWSTHKHAIRDEIVADCIGLIAATKNYDISLASELLGITSDENHIDGRLNNYLNNNLDTNKVISNAKITIDYLSNLFIHNNNLSPFEFLKIIEEQNIGYDLWTE